ncbi:MULTISPECIES: hypothetical protein [Bombella]|uniref:Uncharacterized protein n=1 Tax=Bombella pollinis TaxID=2967337 RepID=A0ABT3WMG2_9PROT|nr:MULTISPECIES: hypothetical protein [Bombella]MCT6856083.1 hypothetical protein [Bombella apis]MCX5618838.1 hypothetical protein [Bombella pollinis]MUG04140.1 hypothetical protein [Bombella sp. ESL0378]
MPFIDTTFSLFAGGLGLGSFSAILLWLQLPGQTPQISYLNPTLAKGLLGVTALLAWNLWAYIFGPIGAFFCLGGLTMALLCLLPICWAILDTYRSSLSS